jgi:DNA-binding NarL/FixJ family response regulator
VSASNTAAAVDTVALITDRGPRQKIVEVLKQEAIHFSVFDDIDTLLEIRTSDAPSLVLLWVGDAVAGLLDRVEPLVRRFDQAPLVVICSRIERWGVRAALSAGATGLVLSENLGSTLGPCVRAVWTGQTCVPRQHWRQIEPPALSMREKQILSLVVMGYMNSQIAKQLFLAESTVKSHLSSAFGKLGVRSRNDAVNLILDSERGLGMGILTLGREPLESTTAATD